MRFIELNSRQQLRVTKEYTKRFARDTELSRAEYVARLDAIATELYAA